MTDALECPACGSSPADRKRFAVDETVQLTLYPCPHCETSKCCMCDMGDDVECLSCLDE